MKSECITSVTLTTLSTFCIFAELPQFLNTLNWETCRCMTHGNVQNLYHHDSFSAHLSLSSTMCKMNNSTHQTTVSSRPQFSFILFSCPFLHPCSSIISTLHHLVLTTPPSSFIESCSTPKHCKGASRSPQSFGKFLPSVSLDWFFAQVFVGQKLEPIMVVPHVLFVVDEGGAMELLFHDLPLIFDTHR